MFGALKLDDCNERYGASWFHSERYCESLGLQRDAGLDLWAQQRFCS